MRILSWYLLSVVEPNHQLLLDAQAPPRPVLYCRIECHTTRCGEGPVARGLGGCCVTHRSTTVLPSSRVGSFAPQGKCFSCLLLCRAEHSAIKVAGSLETFPPFKAPDISLLRSPFSYLTDQLLLELLSRAFASWSLNTPSLFFFFLS